MPDRLKAAFCFWKCCYPLCQGPVKYSLHTHLRKWLKTDGYCSNCWPGINISKRFNHTLPAHCGCSKHQPKIISHAWWRDPTSSWKFAILCCDVITLINFWKLFWKSIVYWHYMLKLVCQEDPLALILPESTFIQICDVEEKPEPQFAYFQRVIVTNHKKGCQLIHSMQWGALITSCSKSVHFKEQFQVWIILHSYIGPVWINVCIYHICVIPLEAGNHCIRHHYSFDLHLLLGRIMSSCPVASWTQGVGRDAIQRSLCIFSMNAKHSLIGYLWDFVWG